MASIDLPRALQDYFAYAETTPTRNGRRFSITLPYVRPDGRLDRLQWWYHLSPAKEMALGTSAADVMRTEAIERFTTHIERWLQNTRQELYGSGTIPHVTPAGNRVLAAYQMDPVVSVDADNTHVVNDKVINDNVINNDAGGDEPSVAEVTPDPIPLSKTAFG